MTRRRGSVFLLTDYGGADEFAGVVRAVVARHAPGAPVVDLSHQVSPFDVRAGALALERAAPYLGRGVVLAVVDPGVGTARRGIAVAARSKDGPRHFVGPDNGLLNWALDALGGAARAVALPPPTRIGSPGPAPTDGSSTFHGRDLFAPVAARLWRGAALDRVGTPVDPGGLTQLVRPHLAVVTGALESEVQWVDRFGNAQLSARPGDVVAARLGHGLDVTIGPAVHSADLVSAFGELADGAFGIVTDANGHLSLVVNRGSAATRLGLEVGDVVVLRPRASSTSSPP